MNVCNFEIFLLFLKDGSEFYTNSKIGYKENSIINSFNTNTI